MSTAMAYAHRCVISARIIGVMERAAPKVKMFMISVLWSDQKEHTVYRLFQDFKIFHRQLKQLAVNTPLQAAGHKGPRVIPKFKMRALRSSLPGKGSSKSVSRVRFLSSYCHELLRCDAMVTQSSELTEFFMPRKHDREPDFTKNSIMVLLSEDRRPSEAFTDTASKPRGSVTYPFVTQTYRCVADHETPDITNLPMKVAENQTLDILIKDPSGWWLVENEDKRLAWFPAPYLEKCEEDEDAEDEVLNGERWTRKDSVADGLDGQNRKSVMYCATSSYSSQEHDELSLNIGSVVERLKKSDDGWWFVRHKGKVGYVPSMFLERYHLQRSRLYSVIGKLPNSSTLNMAAHGLRTVARRGTMFSSFSLPEEPDSPDLSVQRTLESDRTKQLHSDLSRDSYKRHDLSLDSYKRSVKFSSVSPISIPDSYKRSVSTASELSSVSSFSIPDSDIGPVTTQSRPSSFSSSMSSSESGISAYKPRSFRGQSMKDEDGPRMSDGESSGPYLRSTDLPHPGTSSDSSIGTSDGRLHVNPDLRLSQGQHQDHTSSSQPQTSNSGHTSPDDSPPYYPPPPPPISLSQGQDGDHSDHTSSSQLRMSDGESSGPDLRSTDLPHPGPSSDSSGSDRSKASKAELADGKRSSSSDVSPTYGLRLSQGQQDHPDHTSSVQPRMSDGESTSPDLSSTDLPHPGTSSDSSTGTSDGRHARPDLRLSQGEQQDPLDHTSSSQPQTSNSGHTSPDDSPPYYPPPPPPISLSQGEDGDHSDHTSSSQLRMSDGESSGPDLRSTDLPHPDTSSDSSDSERSKGSKAELVVAPEIPRKVVFVSTSTYIGN